MLIFQPDGLAEVGLAYNYQYRQNTFELHPLSNRHQ
jgi:hypothetical protein